MEADFKGAKRLDSDFCRYKIFEKRAQLEHVTMLLIGVLEDVAAKSPAPMPPMPADNVVN